MSPEVLILNRAYRIRWLSLVGFPFPPAHGSAFVDVQWLIDCSIFRTGYLEGPVLRIRYPVPFDPWIRDPRWVKNQDPDPESRFGTNIPDHISESSETTFWVNIVNFFVADADPDPGSKIFFYLWVRDPRSGMEKIWIRDKHPGSATLVRTVKSHLFSAQILVFVDT